MDSGRRPEPIGMKKREAPHVVRPQQCWSSQASSRRGDAREDALRPCLTYRNLLPTTLADAEATCNRCLRLRGEGTRRVTTIPEISPLAQSFLSAVRLQCSDLTQYPSNTHAPSLCKALSSSGWVSPRTIAGARFHVYISHRTGSPAVAQHWLQPCPNHTGR